jgi:hypothetical protein
VLELVAVEEGVGQREVMPDLQYRKTICACWVILEVDRLSRSMSYALQVALRNQWGFSVTWYGHRRQLAHRQIRIQAQEKQFEAAVVVLVVL